MFEGRLCLEERIREVFPGESLNEALLTGL